MHGNVELLIDDNKVVQKSQRSYCKKVFFAQCKVPWHAKIDCVEFQKLNEDERGREDITEEPRRRKNGGGVQVANIMLQRKVAAHTSNAGSTVISEL